MTTKNLEAFMNAIRAAKAPERFNNKFLSQLDFTSSNDRLFIGALKGLGFIDESGVPTKRYYAFLDQTESGKVLAEAVREAYEDWASPGIPDTFDRCEDDIGGVRWREDGSMRSSSVRR
jgi:hypothetical protein